MNRLSVESFQIRLDENRAGRWVVLLDGRVVSDHHANQHAAFGFVAGALWFQAYAQDGSSETGRALPGSQL